MSMFGGLFDIGGGGGGGSFSGGGIGSSQSAQQSDSHQRTNDLSSVDNRVLSDGATAVSSNVTLSTGDITGGDIKITSTDQGAILAGKDIALESMRGLQAANNATASVAKDSISQAYGLANEARQSETSGAINHLITYLFWVAIAGVSAYVIVKNK